ncbi:MAG: DMT family transporter [Rhodospirillales bacterium]|nr:DMT family transporter [Rhodospirillales bacterium]MDH3793251.1 DMT family transporter [Rhodospirillales bacterium]MDH3913694.1 DMT family transporter [Rhodospirillales bacterium]MDH3919453.1 DMT family transporter [Rhodospirillales bacterium]MDH3967243.1 DMT family transporter [Rhodospirillales bacterium]
MTGALSDGAAEAPVAQDANYPLGVAMVLVAGVCLSFGGLILRHVESADIWLMVFYRSVAFAGTLLVFLAVVYRGRLVRPFLVVGREGVVVALALGAGSICYLVAIDLTTVANVVFILGAGPLLTALLGRLVLGERVRPVTWIAMAAALCGIALMVAEGLGNGRLAGNVVAFGAAMAFAVMVVAIRRAKAVDMVPASCLGGLVGAAASATMVGNFGISGHDLGLALLLGSAQLGAGFLLITLGARRVPAAEVPLLALTEVVLAPIWVWLWVSEVPGRLTLLGGAVVLAAVLGQAIIRLRRGRRLGG